MASIAIALEVDDKGSVVVKKFSDKTINKVKQMSDKSISHVQRLSANFTKGLGGAVSKIGKALTSLKTLAIGALAGWGIHRVVSAFERLSGIQEKAEAGMLQAMQSMGRYSEDFKTKILNTATALQSMSNFGDEAVIMGTKFLMTYKNIGNDIMPRAMAAMTDLAALMKGDFVSAGNMIGKASMGMTGELRRVGITVDENIFKSKGFIGILGQIEEQVRGQAAALRTTKMGGLEAFGNIVGDVKEKVGLFTSSIKKNISDVLLPYVERINKKLATLISSGRMEEYAKKVGGAVSETMIKTITAAKDLYTWLTKNYDKMKDMAGTVKDIAVELTKFYVIAKVVGGLTAVITFFQGMTLATGALAIKTALLNKAMKANFLILMGYGSYKIGEFLTNWQSGIGKTKKDIEEWTGIQARLEVKLAAAQAAAQSGIVSGSQAGAPTGVADQVKQKNEEIIESTKITAKEQIQAMIHVAESDKKLLTDRLSEYEKFYSSLQTKITAAANMEKKHVQELNALYRQKADIQKSAAEMISGLRESEMSPMERYKSQESALNQQYFDAMRMSGQEQIKALEEYKRAVASFAGSFRGGVTETSKRFGAESTRTIVESGKIVEDAISNIERATSAQQRALEGLAAEKEKQISADRAWGAMLTSTAQDVAAEVEYLQGTIAGLSDQIEAMQKIIDIDAIDNVSPVVDRIQRELDALHDKTITITTIHRNISVGSGGSGSPAPVQGSYQHGTNYVPRTGLYELHKGEKVTPEKQVQKEKQVLRGAAGIIENDYGTVQNNENTNRSITTRFVEQSVINQNRNKSYSSSTTQKNIKIAGDIIIHIPESAAPQQPEDWREITRTYIKPELERLNG